MVKVLEKVAGTLNFTCQALPMAKPFLHHLYALQYARGDNKTPRKMPGAMVDDLCMFHSFLHQDSPYFVKTVLFKNLLGLNFNPEDIRADAAGGTKGFGCWCNGH